MSGDFALYAALSCLLCMASLAAGLFASSACVGKEPRVEKHLEPMERGFAGSGTSEENPQILLIRKRSESQTQGLTEPSITLSIFEMNLLCMSNYGPPLGRSGTLALSCLGLYSVQGQQKCPFQWCH
jgi:hypothetical protein